MIYKTGLVIFLMIISSGCFKKQEFSDIPSISYISFERFSDSGRVILSFQDGNGDIGLAADELNPPYDPGSKYHYNLYMVYYEKDDVLGWVPGKDFNGDTIVFRNRILPVYKGKPRSIEGKIVATIEPYFYNPFSSQSDTIKYRIKLIDRALHESAWIETEEIIH